MKKILIIISATLLLLTGCVSQNRVQKENNTTKVEVSEDSIFYDVKSIDVSFRIGTLMNAPEAKLTFKNKNALITFINNIKDIENAKETTNIEITSNNAGNVSIGQSYYEGAVDFIGITDATLTISYNDESKGNVEVYEAIDEDTYIAPPDGHRLYITIDGEKKIYENNDSIILNNIVSLVKDYMHYIAVYQNNGKECSYIIHIAPNKIETDDFMISSKAPSFSLNSYIIEYINKHNFKLYENDELIKEIPNDNNSHLITLVDDNDNSYTINYDQIVEYEGKWLDDHSYAPNNW